MSLLEKKQKIKENTFRIIEKIMLRKAIEGLTEFITPLGCMPHQMVINIRVNTAGDTTIKLTNQINAKFIDATHKAEEMEKEAPEFADLVGKIIRMVEKRAKYWNTTTDNIVFIAYLYGEIGNNHVAAKIKPIKGKKSHQFMYVVRPKNLPKK